MVNLEGLQYEDELEAFVREVAKAVCKTHGLDPDDTYDVPAGIDSNGDYLVEQVPNYDRFEDDVYATLNRVFLGTDSYVLDMKKKWIAYNNALNVINAHLEDDDGSPTTEEAE